MGVLVGRETRLLVQGLGRDGAFQASRARDYGTNMVAAVHPGREGQKFEDSVPYFNSVAKAVKETGANVGVIYVPAPAAADAIIEQVDAGIGLTVCITEGVPVLDMMKVLAYMKGKRSRLVGPNCPGVVQPATKVKAGIIPGNIVKPGTVGIVSRSGTLTYEAIAQLSTHGLGESTCVGIGGDPLHGTTFTDVLGLFESDPETEAIVMIGEIGGNREQRAAEFIKKHVKKPVVAAIVGQTAPPGKRMGHAGAIITGRAGLASEKIQALKEAGVHVVDSPAYIGEKMREVLGR
jgi:succinyl-CoA synthetase alpha subunit